MTKLATIALVMAQFASYLSAQWLGYPTPGVPRTADGKATAAPLPYGDKPEFPEAAVLYGSMTKDAKGRFYVVGTMHYKPVVLQITP